MRPIAAGVMVIAASTGRVLLCRRSDDGTWATPGGHIERGEVPTKAAERELREETGYSGALYQPRMLSNNGIYVLFVAVAPTEFRPRLDFEHTHGGWFDPRRPPEPLHPGLRGVLPA